LFKGEETDPHYRSMSRTGSMDLLCQSPVWWQRTFKLDDGKIAMFHVMAINPRKWYFFVQNFTLCSLNHIF